MWYFEIKILDLVYHINSIYVQIVSASPTLLLNAILATWAQFCKDCYIISTCTPSCPATGTAWLWWLAWAGAWLCYPLMWLSIYNKEWDITVIQPISSTSTSELFNTLRPKQNGRHFADDIFKCIFLNENDWISLTISLKFVPKGPINNIPALVQIMAWRRLGDKPLSEPMMVSLPTHICVTRPQWVKKALVDIWIDLYLIKFQFLAILCVFVFLSLEEFFITGVQSCPY